MKNETWKKTIMPMIGAAVGALAVNFIYTQKITQKAFERGQTQAVKNLTTAVETIGTEFRKEFNYYSNHAMLTNDAARCRLLGHGYLEAFERSFLESASEIAKGKIKIEDANHFKCLKRDYDGKIGDIAQF